MIEEKIIEKKKDLLEVRLDRLFHDLFNENEMDTIEWAVMQILKADYKDIHGKVKVNNIRLTNTYQEEKGKYVDLIVDYNDEKIVIELNNNYIGNYMKNLLYAFNVVSNHYNIGSSNEDFFYKRVKVILVNLNWYKTKKLGKKIEPKVEKIIEYPDETMENEPLIKIININLDFYKNLCYTEIEKWDKLWKLLTFDNFNDLSDFIKDEELLQNYQEKIHSLSSNEEYKKMLLNDNIIENVEHEVYFNAGRNEGIYSNKVEMIINMYNDGLSIEKISLYANLSIEEIKNIINENIGN